LAAVAPRWLQVLALRLRSIHVPVNNSLRQPAVAEQPEGAEHPELPVPRELQALLVARAVPLWVHPQTRPQPAPQPLSPEPRLPAPQRRVARLTSKPS